MSNALWWPRTLLAPRRCTAEIMPVAGASGGRSLTGMEQAVSPDAGYWKIVYDEIPLVSPDQKRAWRGIARQLAGRRNTIAVPIYDDNAPWPGALRKPRDPTFSDDDLFSDAMELNGNVIVATLHGAALRGAVQVSIQVTTGSDLGAGMHFSVDDILYRITEATLGSPEIWACTVTPPLRASIASGRSLNFDDPRCTVHLSTDRQMDSGADDYAGRALAKVEFVEACGVALSELSYLAGGGGQCLNSAGQFVNPAAYTTSAVNFDGNNYLYNASLTAPSSYTCVLSYWIYAGTGTHNSDGIWCSDHNNNFSFGDLTSGVLTTQFSDPTGGAASRTNCSLVSGAWHHILVAVDTSAATYKIACYLDGVFAANSTGAGTPTPAKIAFGGLDFVIGAEDFHFFTATNVNLADFWLCPGASMLESDLTISAANIAKFRDAGTGKPVSLGADGSTPTGTAPAIFLRRAPGALASTFATNLGTGGDFTVTLWGGGAGTLGDAPSSPTD